MSAKSMDVFSLCDTVVGGHGIKRVMREVHDAMAAAARTSKPHQTRLDPPLADPRVAHPDTHLAAEKKGAR